MVSATGARHYYVLNDQVPAIWYAELITTFPEWDYQDGFEIDDTSNEYQTIIAAINRHASYIRGIIHHPRVAEVYDTLCKESLRNNHLIIDCNKLPWIFCIWSEEL